MIYKRLNSLKSGYIGLVLGLLSSPSMAADLGLPEINQALASIPAQGGQFEQTLPNGTRTDGTYLIDWPDYLRFAYTNNGAVVTVKENFVAVQDTPRSEPNWFPVTLTPLSVIRSAIQKGISSDMVVEMKHHENSIALTLHDPTGELPGRATLYFTRPGLVLYAWSLVDIQNTVTQVRLTKINLRDDLKAADFAIAYDEISGE